jgi:disulfide bond formation protein DsbB
VNAVTLFLASLAVAAEVAVLVALVLAAGSRNAPAIAATSARVRGTVAPDALWLAFLVALVATLGSLYLSEVANFVPCKLCWYQRIAMYPLAPVLGVAAWRRDRSVVPYVAMLAALGGTVSAYHVVLERFPNLESGICDPSNPCTLIWVQRFGYLTIPAMALSAFALIAVLVLAGRSPEETP